MQRAYDDMAENYFVPPQAVTLASLGVPPYSPPAEDREDEYPASSGSADGSGLAEMNPFGATPPAAWANEAPGGISFADMVRTISPAAEPGAWREDNRAPFWIPDDPRASSGPSFNDVIRTIDPRANPDVWPSDAPRYAGWDDAERYAVPDDPRGVALGAFRIPGLPEDATGWGLRESSPAGVDDIVPVLLASRWGRDILAKVWKAIGGVPGGRRPDGPPASAPSGRKGFPLGTPEGPSRNPPGKIKRRPVSGHAFDKMQDEGVPPSIVLQAIRRGKKRPDRDPGVTRYYDEEHNLSVFVDDKTKRVITIRHGDR